VRCLFGSRRLITQQNARAHACNLITSERFPACQPKAFCFKKTIIL